MTLQSNNVNRLVLMMVSLIVIIIGIAVLIMPQAQGEDNAVFKGYVTERGSGSAIEGAQVNLWGDSEGNTTYTIANGYFQMNIPDGDYHVQVNKDGYWDHNNPINIGYGEVRNYDVTLAPETAVIKGVVTDEDCELWMKLKEYVLELFEIT